MANATKHALAGALLELLNTTTLDNITVKDIVERAQVSRQTFYYHFGDVYQLCRRCTRLARRFSMRSGNWVKCLRKTGVTAC